jgi:hypothetical protein
MFHCLLRFEEGSPGIRRVEAARCNTLAQENARRLAFRETRARKLPLLLVPKLCLGTRSKEKDALNLFASFVNLTVRNTG